MLLNYPQGKLNGEKCTLNASPLTCKKTKEFKLIFETRFNLSSRLDISFIVDIYRRFSRSMQLGGLGLIKTGGPTRV